MPAYKDMSPLEYQFQIELNNTRKLAQTQTSKIWAAQETFHEFDIAGFVEKLDPVVQAAESRAVSLTSAYLTQSAGYNINQLFQVNPDEVIPTLRGGLEPVKLYTRAFQTVWNGLANKLPLPLAIQQGGNRLISAVAMNVSLSMQATTPRFAQINNPTLRRERKLVVIGYRRVSAPACCDFCDMIDGAFCLSGDAMPLHNNCNCTLAPVMGSQEQADANQEKLDAKNDVWLYENAAGEWVPREQDTKGLTYRVEQNTELGPVLSSKRGAGSDE